MRRSLIAFAFCALAAPAHAASLSIALSAGATGFDPHFYDHDPTNALARHVFDTLVGVGPNQQIVPALAESWTPVGDTVWEFKLRRGVRFHNGAPFTAADVKHSFERALQVKNSPGSFEFFLRPIVKFETVDDFTIRLTTATPLPILPNYLSAVFITSASVGDAGAADFASGKAAIGTGPYRFVSFSTTDRTVFARNPDHWGGAASWDEVRLDVIPNPTTRIAALLAGNVDVVEQVPTASIQEIRRDPRVAVWEGVSNRTMFINLLVTDDRPGIAAKDGAPIANPLKDVRVRRALSLAVDRAAIVERVMEGQGIAAGQIVPPGFHGFDPDTKAPVADPAAARRLLAEAGLPNGFRIALAGTNDRYPNDRRTLETVAQMWTRIGVETSVEAIPSQVFFTRASRQEFSAFMVGFGAGTTGALSVYRGNLMTFDRTAGTGAQNRGRYSSAALDAIMTEALRTMDVAKRDAMLREVARIAADDVAVIPLHYLTYTWATRKGLSIETRTDGFTLATSVRPGG